MKLYLKDKVEVVEMTEDFTVAMAVSKKRKNSAQKATETKRAKTIKKAEEIQFDIPDKEIKELIQLAIKDYEDYNCTTVFYKDEDFIARITLNYIRHKCTKYDRVLNQLKGSVGIQETYEIIKEKVNGAIKDKYAFLKDEDW